MSTAVSRGPGSAAFAFVFVTVVLDMMAVGIVAPVLPKLILQFESGDVADAAFYAGLFATLWAAMQFLASPVIGAASDRFGRRPVILLSNLGLGLDYLLMAWAPSLAWLFVGRLLSGVTSASFPTAGAYIADVTPPEARAARFGMLGAAFGLGFVIGPAVGGLLGSIDLRLPFQVAAGLSLLNVAYGFFILPESLPPERRRPFRLREASVLGALRLLRSHPGLPGLGAVLFVAALAHEALPNLFVLYTDRRYGWDATTVGLALGLVGLSSVLVSAGLVRPLVRRFGERRAALGGLGCGLLGFLVFGFAPNGRIYLAGIALVALWSVAGPSVQALMSRRVDPSEQGQLQGAIGSLRAITGMLGPLLFTQVFGLVVARGGEATILGTPYFLAAGLVLVAFLVGWRVLPRRAT